MNPEALRTAFPQLSLRPSDYNIYVESSDADRFVVAHGYTGTADEVSAETFRWLTVTVTTPP